jgi:hypothetical protein
VSLHNIPLTAESCSEPSKRSWIVGSFPPGQKHNHGREPSPRELNACTTYIQHGTRGISHAARDLPRDLLVRPSSWVDPLKRGCLAKRLLLVSSFTVFPAQERGSLVLSHRNQREHRALHVWPCST